MEPGTIGELLITFITSFKLWISIYGSFLLICDTIFFSYFPVTVIGSFLLFGVLYKFRIPAPDPAIVNRFFGQQFRPSVNGPLTSTAPPEDQPGLTVKSRLLLMKSPPSGTATTSTRAADGHQSADGLLVVIGHRGAGLDAPENSLSAIRQCKLRGCEAVEFDVALTKDLVPVLFHDDNLIRIAGIDREIRDMTWEELSRLDISVMHPLGDRFRGERVPKFDEAVDLCLSLGIKFIIDLKDDNETIANAVVEAFKRRGTEMYSMAVVSSFYVKVVYEIRARDPNIIGCMAWRPGYYRYVSWSSNWENMELRYKAPWQNWVAIVLDAMNNWALKNMYWWFVGLSAILFHKDAITREETYRWMKKGVRSYVWTVNSPLEKLNFVQNVQLGYLTDTLDGGEVNTVSSLQASPMVSPQRL